MKKRLVVASHNLHKIREIKEMLSDVQLEVVGLPEVAEIAPVDEDGDTFEANAKKKAIEIAILLGELVLADDSGLEVDALLGAPGVHSARYAGEPSSDERNNALLLRNMAHIPEEERGAQFRSVVALASPAGWVEVSEGVCRGTILSAPRGKGGFGYDPLFFVPEQNMTFAELPPEMKNRISHRFLAMQGMLEIIQRFCC